MCSIAYGLQSEGLVCLIGAVVCLLAALQVRLFNDPGNEWLHSALRYH